MRIFKTIIFSGVCSCLENVDFGVFGGETLDFFVISSRLIGDFDRTTAHVARCFKRRRLRQVVATLFPAWGRHVVIVAICSYLGV